MTLFLNFVLSQSRLYLINIFWSETSLWPGLCVCRFVGWLVCLSKFPKRAGSYTSKAFSNYLLLLCTTALQLQLYLFSLHLMFLKVVFRGRNMSLSDISQFRLAHNVFKKQFWILNYHLPLASNYAIWPPSLPYIFPILRRGDIRYWNNMGSPDFR